MENATKALLLAGSILLGIIVLSIFMLMVNNLTNYQLEQDKIGKNQDIIAFNNQFQGYMRKEVSGTDVLSVINKVMYYNSNKVSDEITKDEETNDKENLGKKYVYEPIELIIELDKEESDTTNRRKLAMGANNELFKASMFRFSKTDNPSVYSDIDNLLKISEKMPKAPNGRKIKYTESILKGLVDNYNSADSIFDQDFLNKDMAEKKKRFIIFNRIIGQTYFTLVDINGNDISEGQYNTWWNNYFSDSSDNGKAIKNVLARYYEYAQFQRGIFEYVEPTEAEQSIYSESTGRIIYMKFKFTGEFV